MSWQFSPNAKKVRRAVYGHFLHGGWGKNNTAIMAETGLSQSEVEVALEELERGLMVMLQPGTHDVVKCPPWTNTPSRHAIAQNGKFVSFAGCSIEAINMSHCYPGDVVTIQSMCPQSGKHINLTFKDGQLLDLEPVGLVMHFGINPVFWEKDWFKACDNNNFFASAADVKSWETAHPEFKGVVLTAEQFPRLATYSRRLDFERGADVNPAIMLKFISDIGIPLPPGWAT